MEFTSAILYEGDKIFSGTDTKAQKLFDFTIKLILFIYFAMCGDMIQPWWLSG